ncbi:hypothetical protein ACFWZT_24545 [Streptomyces alboflavus]|uniref:nSTAND1 domain-containing NTPase n=1 Tax=Streptomyces alboflavus TaxID=67267 RepID=UPI0036870AE3
MGRPETLLDPGAGPVQEFAYALRKLRQEADSPTYREMARSARYSVTALSQAAAGTALPSLAVTLAYVRACGGNVPQWEDRWKQAHEATALAEPRDDRTQPPYQGLARFEPDDHDRFFGRDTLVDVARTLVGAHRFTAVLGPSGSGKSSLLRAGLIPALRARTDGLAAIRILTPGEHPLRTHAPALDPADGDADTVVLVDQFEEVFTLCHDPAERAAFIDRLLAAREPDSRLRVVIAVRADFYGRCAEHRALADALTASSLLVGPMSDTELREAVVQPARTAGLIVERDLTTRLISETKGEPGGLPLLSHVLLETWRRSRGRTLTVEAYEAAGGLHGAIAQTAETVHTRLTDTQADLARQLLLRLIAPGEGAPDTRRPVPRCELDLADDTGDVDQVLDRLARARLITLDDDTVDLAHEALIPAWPRLRGWIDADRERLLVHRRLTEAAHAWAQLHHHRDSLWRGPRLTAAEEHWTTPSQQQSLTSLERDFLRAGTAARRRARRLRRVLVAVVSVLAVLASLAGGLALQQHRTAARQYEEQEGRKAAMAAVSLMASPSGRDRVLGMKLSVAAWRIASVEETKAVLSQARYIQYTSERLSFPRDPVTADPEEGEELRRTLFKGRKTFKIFLADDYDGGKGFTGMADALCAYFGGPSRQEWNSILRAPYRDVC